MEVNLRLPGRLRRQNSKVMFALKFCVLRFVPWHWVILWAHPVGGSDSSLSVRWAAEGEGCWCSPITVARK